MTDESNIINVGRGYSGPVVFVAVCDNLVDAYFFVAYFQFSLLEEVSLSQLCVVYSESGNPNLVSPIINTAMV